MMGETKEEIKIQLRLISTLKKTVETKIGQYGNVKKNKDKPCGWRETTNHDFVSQSYTENKNE